MRSITLPFIALFTSLLSIAPGHAQLQWRVFYQNGTNGQLEVLDTKDKVLISSTVSSLDAVTNNGAKGQRYRWGGSGDNVNIECQTSTKHFVGFDANKQQFKADFAQNHVDALVQIHADASNSTAVMCNNDNCIGSGGSPVSQSDPKATWAFHVIQQA
ncbi:uncharacterized protein FOMMEDRAFT_150528 [Fomitiporia mediterranea MF3/22]|uniref:uncharacterized protein n=1 Tax=Fomitiporia mediterranea (strain MF3/22) TaxID=694068 RepID=UPI0004409CE0|nr:uncharacterized protein FOMMEDRAFT_150528 [Fomitiporia mediterranea MF3/22]EJD07933.1 hypothetical protein FOMMEDRAFT_150528 [Fomitiporia mediterranea MF3/22]